MRGVERERTLDNVTMLEKETLEMSWTGPVTVTADF